MIRIDRNPTPPALDVFTKPTVKAADGTKISRARSEALKAMAFFTDAANYANNARITDKKFTFAVYKDPALAKALEAIFGHKCAYCESDFGRVTPKDVEHFRPKSEIDNGTATPLAPGYFWLACEWTNLLVSCPDCNRARNHEVPGQSGNVRLGKETQFPLSDETRRVRAPGDVSAEEAFRLLIDPCVDQPEEHLTFDDNGLVHPRDIDDEPSRMGKTSIDVYALQRKFLVEGRLKVLNRLVFNIEQVRKLAVSLDAQKRAGVDEDILELTRTQIRDLKDHLTQFTQPNAEYIAMVRDYIRRNSRAGRFDDLKTAGIDLEQLLIR